jgi:thiol-disulfide isomerase/thioredoxin
VTSRRGSRITAITLCTALALAPACSASDPSPERPTARRAEPFRFEDVNPASVTHGSELSLEELYGERGVVLNFVASWCPPCWDEAPELERLRGSLPVPIVSIAADEYGPPGDLLRLAGEAGVTSPLLLVPRERIDWMSERYGHSMLPATYLIDETGTILDVLEGQIDAERLQKAVDAAFAR